MSSEETSTTIIALINCNTVTKELFKTYNLGNTSIMYFENGLELINAWTKNNLQIVAVVSQSDVLSANGISLLENLKRRQLLKTPFCLILPREQITEYKLKLALDGGVAEIFSTPFRKGNIETRLNFLIDNWAKISLKKLTKPYKPYKIEFLKRAFDLFFAGMALICLFVVFLKNSGYLEYTNEEHLHDIGKFMFAFSVFWTYLWFSQFMLIWYANIPEETTYFKPRAQGIYSGIFWMMFIINFLAPLLILMRRGAKRNYTTITFMALLIIFGHWLDFFQMVFPGVSKDKVPMLLYDFGVALGFVGLIMFVTGKALSKAPLLAKNHPFVKESVIHHT